MKKYSMKTILSAAFAILCAVPAQAQVPSPSAAAIERLPTSSLDVFPKLPPSTFCTKENLLGMWKLLMVYEVPSGREIKFYTNNPLQFYVFNADSRYGRYESVLHAITLADVKRIAMSQISNTQQYTLNQSGTLFFYKNQVAVDSLACFIVAANSGPFLSGQLLLMPPKKSQRTRMVKVYQKMFPEFESQQPPVNISPASEE
jgi:hypothetical protein